MQVTYREPVTDAERGLLAAFHAEMALNQALGYVVAPSFIPASLDRRRFDKALRRERDASAVRLAHLSTAVMATMAPMVAS